MDRSFIKKLLEFGYNEDRTFGFAKAGLNTVIFDRNINTLSGIDEKMLAVRDALSDDEIQKLIDRLYVSWKAKEDSQVLRLTSLEAKSIGYGIRKDLHIDFIAYIIRVEEFEENWSPSCLKGFLHSLLRNWTDFKDNTRDLIATFISSHIEEADEKMQTVGPYITADGPIQLAIALKKSQLSIYMAAPTLLLPSTRINYGYFSDTLVNYYKGGEGFDYDNLLIVLNMHNQARTDKLLLPALIKSSGYPNKNLLNVSLKRIGDPFDEAKWAPFDGASSVQTKDLADARRILLSWITREIIRRFFNILSNDKDRQSFWSKHAHQVHDFKVFGSYDTRMMLFRDLPHSVILKHYITVDSSNDNCALAMYIGDYVIVEFTQVGALYAYKFGSAKYRQAFRYSNSLSKIDELKVPGFPLLYDLDTHTFSVEGKMDHRGSWAYRMNNWINHQIMPIVNLQ